MTSRTVSIEAAKRRLHARLNAKFGDVQPPAEDDGPQFTQAGDGAPFIHVEFHDHRPSHILPILAVVTEYGRGISTITLNMKARRR